MAMYVMLKVFGSLVQPCPSFHGTQFDISFMSFHVYPHGGQSPEECGLGTPRSRAAPAAPGSAGVAARAAASSPLWGLPPHTGGHDLGPVATPRLCDPPRPHIASSITINHYITTPR